MADTLGLGPSGRKVVGVQVPPAADLRSYTPENSRTYQFCHYEIS